RTAPSSGTPVITATTSTVQDDQLFTAIGTGFASRSVTLRAPSSGKIIALDIAAGARFAQGDTVMRIEDTDQRFAVSLAQARFERATADRDRFRRLQNAGTAATVRYEETQTEFKVAEIALEQARADLDNRVLRAPFDGIAGLARVDIGDRIAVDDPVASFDDRRVILVEFDLPEALLGRVALGLPLQASTPSAEGRSFDGEIAVIDSRINAATRTARVRAAIDNAGDLLRPGASFSLRLDLPGQTFPAVPELALQFADGTLHVWRVVDDVAERVPVRLVRRRSGHVIVDGPLVQGDRVVVEGTQRLRAGAKVVVLNAPGETS
ncbi:MAG: efflux RND transporter periplasmic adaptor subunit, partial [Sedimentitalea sp.]